MGRTRRAAGIALGLSLLSPGCLDAPAGGDGGAGADAGPPGSLVAQLHVGAGTTTVATTPTSDDLFLTGSFTDEIELGDQTLALGGSGRDMFVARMSPDGVFKYAVAHGGAGDERPTAIVADPVTHEVVVTGLYIGVGGAGDGDFPETVNDIDNMFVAGYDDLGAHRWSHAGVTTMLVQPAPCITLGGAGQVLLGGYFDDSFKLGPAPTLTGLGGHDAYYTTVSSSGVVSEVARYGTDGLQAATGAVASTFSSRVYLIGIFDTSFGVGGKSEPVSAGFDGFVVAMNPEGTVAEWMVTIPGAGGVEYLIGAPRPDGGLVLFGWFLGELDLALPTPTTFTADARDLVLLSMSPDGDLDWAVQLGGPGDDLATAVTVGDDGAIWVTGQFDGSASFAGTLLDSEGATDIFVARFEPDGELAWARGFGGPQADAGTSVAPGPDGSVYAGVVFRGPVDFGGDEPLGAGDGAVHAAVIRLR